MDLKTHGVKPAEEGKALAAQSAAMPPPRPDGQSLNPKPRNLPDSKLIDSKLTLYHEISTFPFFVHSPRRTMVNQYSKHYVVSPKPSSP